VLKRGRYFRGGGVVVCSWGVGEEIGEIGEGRVDNVVIY